MEESTKGFPRFSTKFGNLAFALVTMLRHPDEAYTKPELDRLIREWRKPLPGAKPSVTEEELNAAVRAAKEASDAYFSAPSNATAGRYNDAQRAVCELKRARNLESNDRAALSMETFYRPYRDMGSATTANGYFKLAGKKGKHNAQAYLLTLEGAARACHYERVAARIVSESDDATVERIVTELHETAKSVEDAASIDPAATNRWFNALNAARMRLVDALESFMVRAITGQ